MSRDDGRAGAVSSPGLACRPPLSVRALTLLVIAIALCSTAMDGQHSQVIADVGREGVGLTPVAPSTTLARAGPIQYQAPTVSPSPSTICVQPVTSCSAGTDLSLATINFTATGLGVAAWPAVQILFVLETTPYDGVFNGSIGMGGGNDPCAGGAAQALHPSRPLCDESNGVPFFVANAEAIAEAIQQSHPATRISFGLVDFGASDDQYDDSDGAEHPFWSSGAGTFRNVTTEGWAIGPESVYHVDIGNFVPAAAFGSAVASTFQQEVLSGGFTIAGSNLSTNILHSDSIAALYGALAGVGVNWSSDTHHVVVWIGSTAPKDPVYVQNYCVSDSNWAPYAFPIFSAGITQSECLGNSSAVLSPSCEPAYTFEANLTMPSCFGWVESQDANASYSIAALSRDSSDCADSLGSVCTIDTISLFATPTDGQSLGWSAPDGAYVGYIVPYNGSDYGEWWPMMDAHRVISAACDLANATGGTWDGPVIDSCGSGRNGTLLNVPYGRYYFDPNSSNPTLLAALAAIGLGAAPPGLVGLGSSGPMFTFVPLGLFEVDLQAPITSGCDTSTEIPSDCQTTPVLLSVGETTYLAWNWSYDPNLNVLYSGDTWTASFYVRAAGPPFNTPLPIDACVTGSCAADGSHALEGEISEVTFQPAYTAVPAPPPESTSLPPGLVTVEPAPAQNPITSIPSPPPPGGQGPPAPNPISLPSPISGPVAIASGVAGTAISVQAVAAGLLGAGFARVALQRRAISQGQPVGNVVRPKRSAFEEDRSSDVKVGRFD
jgi:hypothetical protein